MTDPEVRIRTAVADDAEAVMELLAAGALTTREDPTDVAAYRDALADLSRTPGTEVLVAEVDDAVVGVCQLLIFRHIQEAGGWCAELESVHVRSGLRGAGIGARLVAAAVDRARQAGCYRVQLTSNMARADAHRFWEREGFAPTHMGFKRYLDGR